MTLWSRSGSPELITRSTLPAGDLHQTTSVNVHLDPKGEAVANMTTASVMLRFGGFAAKKNAGALRPAEGGPGRTMIFGGTGGKTVGVAVLDLGPGHYLVMNLVGPVGEAQGALRVPHFGERKPL